MPTQWFRFMTPAGTVYGEVQVPATPPNWFVPILKRLNEGARRELTMSDISPEEWLDTLCSESRPIQLSRPLSPQPQEELVFFAPGKVEEMKAAAKKLSEPDGDRPGIPIQAIYGDDNFLKKYATLMNDLDKVPEEERVKLQPIPRNKVQPGKGRTFVNYIPLVDPESDDEDVETYNIYPFQINSRIAVRSSHDWQKMVGRIYGQRVQAGSAEQVSRILPAS